MKKKYSRLRELWAVPKYKILIKFGMYAIFFALLLALSGISSYKQNHLVKNKEETQTILTTNFTKIKKTFLNSNLNIKYTINDYYITGTIENNVLTGTLETTDGIKKIKYDTNLYQITKGEEALDETSLLDINKTYLLPSNIIKETDESSSVTKSADEKIYSYLINEKAISFYLNKNEINKIIVLDNGITYTLEYSIIKDNKTK